jgi:hypothetical protein
MMQLVRQYFEDLGHGFSHGWNRFWFTPADSLPLSVIRVLTGLIGMYWYLTLAPDLNRLLGPGGWLPVDAVKQLEGRAAPFQPSYFDYFTGTPELWIVYVIGALVLAAFAVGWYSRITAALALVVVLSTIHRAPLLGTQVETVLTLVLFYLAFAPTGDYLSVDAWLALRRRATPGPALPVAQSHVSLSAGVVLRALQVHLAMLYACMGLSKLFAESWWTGLSVWWLIARSESRLMDLTWLHSHPFIVNCWSHAIVLFELAFAILIWNRLARPLLLAVAVVIWISVTLLTGQVPYLVMILTANLAFVSPEFLRRVLGFKAPATTAAIPAI